MKKIKVVIWGYGAMGKGMAEMLIRKKGVEITGVCDLNPSILGRSIYSLFALIKYCVVKNSSNKPKVILPVFTKIAYFSWNTVFGK